ncbi:kinase-like domain-containing protein [Chaetomidium leptoderma]|uniref:Kinase-like domain-containing protein n=1 Tax=Chaetomidium leptoderma TaxID=669021 RepID=A0AAN6VN39_9PEZI|nr:kinase-like domain-containing protein [Chaetomidium leptoderma]
MVYWNLTYVVDTARAFSAYAARWVWPSPDPWAIELLPKTYNERVEGKLEPRKRWLNLILRSSRSKWHLRVTFWGTIQDDQKPISSKRPKRRKDLEDLCRCIDFQQIQLLYDTVTEVLLTRERDCDTESSRLPCKTQPDSESEYASVVGHLWVRTREDPLRLRFPVYEPDSGIPTKDLSEIEISEEDELDGGVYKVRLRGDEAVYVYKQVERPHYVSGDSDVLEQELRNLGLFRGKNVGIVQLVAAITSTNPHQTVESKKDIGSAVLRGFLLEYHPNGTLQDALKSTTPETDGQWRRWGLQITTALAHLHRCGITHMDLKPSNVVISASLDAVLIDVSGIGGVTRQWLSPEMLEGNDPLSRDTEPRMQNDIWALGQMLLAMADMCCAKDEEQLLRSIALSATRTPPRICLGDAITTLSGPPSHIIQNSSQSMSVGLNPPSVIPPVE